TDERIAPGASVAMAAMSMRVYAVEGLPEAGAPEATLARVRIAPSPAAPGEAEAAGEAGAPQPRG
ncbi:hypothetical protein, partial [Escherichia coli]|uniref:hypothetical protein n=1 Tax=Escherichia coli TaxID=562 RepID=UPI0019310C86